jgi:hypothetical protein
MLILTTINAAFNVTLVEASTLPENRIELIISNSLNVTRTDEPAIIRWINLTESGIPEDANPYSFRVTDKDGNEVPSQFDDITAYGYEKYLVFPATVPGSSNATYYLYYTTGSWTRPTYTKAVNITETDTAYSFTAQNYSGIINKTNGVMASLKTSNSGELLSGRGFDSEVFGPNWSPA